MNGDDVSLLRPATPEDHTAHTVARSGESTADNRPAQRRAGTPSELADTTTATLGDALGVSSCDYGTQDCREPATVAVSVDGLPARPMCRRHTVVLVDSVAVYGDRMTLQIHRLDPDDRVDPVQAVAEALHADQCPDDECDGGDMGEYERMAEIAVATRLDPGRP